MDIENIVSKIVAETDLSEDDVEKQVESKMEEFEGLVSEEGAVHLVAKENDVEVAEDSSQDLKVENIVPEMRKVNLKVRVVNIMDPNTFERDDGSEGKVQNMVLGDDTGTIRLALWDDQTSITDEIEEGDPIQIETAYTIEDDRGNPELRLGDNAQVKMADEDEVPKVRNGSDTTETDIRGISTENASFKVKGMLMTVYTSNPFYSTCPECGSTVRPEEDDEETYICPEHGEVEPNKALAVSGVIDDGTDNIRTVFFREQARKILDISEEEELEGDIQKVENAVDDAVGKELEIEGRTRYNDYFGRLELIANNVKELDPEKQVKELLDIMEV